MSKQTKQAIAAPQAPPAAGITTTTRPSPQPQQPQFHPPTDAYVHPDTPIWRQELSYRGQAYRYLFHQRGIIGYVKVRVVAARELNGKSSSYKLVRVTYTCC